MHPAQLVVEAQLAAFTTARARRPAHPLVERLGGERSPAEIAELVARVARNSAREVFAAPDDAARRLRREHAAALGLSAADLAFRDLYPGLDLGLYGCSHSMGMPSVAGPAAVLEQLAQLATSGIAVWDEGTWPDVMDRYRVACAELVGGNLRDGDVAWFPNVSEALSAVLEGIEGGTLVYTRGHFTTGHYVHHQWAHNCGGRLLEVDVDPDGSVPIERLVDALDPSVRVVSISHALFESGWLQDLPRLARAVRERCPEALLLVDAYQTAGTVPIDAAALGDHVAVTAGGHKQLRSSAGASFLYVPRRWCASLTPRRTGWWGHAAPFAFEKGAVRRAEDASRFSSGTPTLAGMVMLLGELAALSSSAGGSLCGAVQRARAVTSGIVGELLGRAAARGLEARGDWGPERRGAFICVRVQDGLRVVEELGHRGVRVDARPIHDGSGAAWVRVSGNSAAFAYEAHALIDALAEHPRLP